MIDNKVREYRLQNHLSQKELACRVEHGGKPSELWRRENTIPHWNWLSGLPENWMYL